MAETREQMLRRVEILLMINPDMPFSDFPEDFTWDDLAEVETRIAKKWQEAANGR
jgi:hypothetical protein